MSTQPPKGTVEFDSVSKRYRLGAQGTLRGTVAALLRGNRNTGEWRRTLWAVRDVSFRLSPGDSLGLIGPNGSGKTTTLKLLSGITRPTDGRIAVQGRTSALIELGAGFHPELTGRENIYLNGAILGLRRHEIARRLDAIISFSELERFIDTPVKRYSSGMYVRLGFAVAAHVEPDVLLVDEVLAVGDASFRHRCIEHMRNLRRNGTTVLFVSHNMHLVRDMCDQILLLMQGEIKASGEPDTVISEYEKLMLSADTSALSQITEQQPSLSTQAPLALTEVRVLPLGRGQGDILSSHLPATVQLHFRTATPQYIGRIVVWLMRDDGTLCCTADSSMSSSVGQEVREFGGDGVIDVKYEPIQLASGTYTAEVRVTDSTDAIVIASGRSQSFRVLGGPSGPNRGVYVPQVSWARHSQKPDGFQRATR